MLLTFAVLIAYVVFAGRYLFNGQIEGFFQRALIILVLGVVVIIWTVVRITRTPKTKKRKAAAPQAAARSSAVTDSGSVSFRVAGVTFKNEDGTSRQDILRHIKFEDSPYADGIDPIDLNVTIEETEYNGEQAFAVFANGYQIGFVPKGSIDKVAEAMACHCSVTSAEIIGGGRDDDGNQLSYGCVVKLEY